MSKNHNEEPFALFQGQLVRRTVAEMLQQVNIEIPGLILYEGWRSYERQTELFTNQKAVNRELFPDMSETELDLYTHNQVAIPSKDPLNPSPHATGGAVDVGISGLDFGSAYLEMTDAAHTEYENIPKSAKKNRQLLRNAMEAAGFVNFPYEWWHYEYGIDTWAKVNKRDPIYFGIFEKPVKVE